jgi:hypothetical protein
VAQVRGQQARQAGRARAGGALRRGGRRRRIRRVQPVGAGEQQLQEQLKRLRAWS